MSNDYWITKLFYSKCELWEASTTWLYRQKCVFICVLNFYDYCILIDFKFSSCEVFKETFECFCLSEKLFSLRKFFPGWKRKSSSASLKPSHQSNKFLYMAFFSRGFCEENELKQRNVKKTTRDKHFLCHEKKRFLFSCLF